MCDGSVNISGGSLTSNSNVIFIDENVNATVTITGTSTVVKGSSSTHYTIVWIEGSSGTMTVGESSSSSTTYPFISNPKSGRGIYFKSGSSVTYKKLSGKVS